MDQMHHSLKFETDSVINSLLSFTVKKPEALLKAGLRFCCLYKDLKIYENHTLPQTSKIFSKLIIKTPETTFLKQSFFVDFEHVFVC